MKISKGKTINNVEFEEMSDRLASIDYEFGINDKEFEALEYFADLHDVSIIEVVGIDNKEAVEAIFLYFHKVTMQQVEYVRVIKEGGSIWPKYIDLVKSKFPEVRNEDFRKRYLGDWSQEEDKHHSKEEVIESIKQTVPKSIGRRNPKSRLHDDVHRASIHSVMRNTIQSRIDKAKALEKIKERVDILLASDLTSKNIY